MRRKKYCFILAALLIFTVVFLWYYVISLQKTLKDNIEEFNLLKLETSLLLDNCMLQYTYNSRKMNDFIVYDKNNKEANLSSVLGEEYKIIFKFSYLHCTSCINSVMTDLKRLYQQIPHDRIIILATYENRRHYLTFVANQNIEIPIYFVDSKEEDEVLALENMPYVCLLNKNLEIKNLLIPIKEIPSHSKRYYEIMKERYFDTENSEKEN